MHSGVYRVSGKEVTLHTVSGALYVYRPLASDAAVRYPEAPE